MNTPAMFFVKFVSYAWLLRIRYYALLYVPGFLVLGKYELLGIMSIFNGQRHKVKRRIIQLYASKHSVGRIRLLWLYVHF